MKKLSRMIVKPSARQWERGAFLAALLVSSTILHSQFAFAQASFDPNQVTSWPIDKLRDPQVRLMQDRLIEVKKSNKQLEQKVLALTKSSKKADAARSRAENELANLKSKLAAMPAGNPDAVASAVAAHNRAESAEKRITELQAVLEQKSAEIADGKKEINQLSISLAELKRSNAALIANMSSSAPVLGRAHFTTAPSQNPSVDKLNACYLRQANQKIMDAVHYDGGTPPAGTVCFTIASDGRPVIAPLSDGTLSDADSERAARKIERLVKMAGPYHPLLGDSSGTVLQLAFTYSVEGLKPSLSMHLAAKPSSAKE